jgi:hypothetical protein
MPPEPKPLPKFAAWVTIAVTIFVASSMMLRAINDHRARLSGDAHVGTTHSASSRTAGAR